ncbi:hypothetical protein LOY54_14440 [Pseudomonas sp. B21-032]|uniref:hypothetical protein n=1 Tax=Pseudomonas sp. B21-032 TaxID=2895483 RepID=UPI0021604402|nr:hypothetical protein [Pseudomonas sp. B21-032]UVL59257.1 hypothetical protein LOY54_14440 [Pseudomonas sp. B21-032]
MPTENRSSNTEQMVSVPRSAADVALKLIARNLETLANNSARRRNEKAGLAFRSALLAQPAAQHQGEPVAWRYREHGSGKWSVTQESPGSWYMGAAGYEIEPLHTHADAGEVERLQGEALSLSKIVQDLNDERDALGGEAGALRTQLAERDVLLRRWVGQFGHLGGCATPLRDETNAALSASAEQSAPVERGPWQPVTAPGQIQEGAWLSFTVAGSFICAQARLIINPGTAREEIIYNRQKNHYFVTSMAIDGTSTHKGVLVAKAQV